MRCTRQVANKMSENTRDRRMNWQRSLLNRTAYVLPGLEIRVFGKVIVYCVDRRVAAVAQFFVRPAENRISKEPDFQSGRNVWAKQASG